jgi:hypothetical protein
MSTFNVMPIHSIYPSIHPSIHPSPIHSSIYLSIHLYSVVIIMYYVCV